MSRRYWRISSFDEKDKRQAANIAYEYGYDEFAILLLNSRGITDPADIGGFLENPPEISDPFLIKDMDRAVDCILGFIDRNEKIAVYGDYDADGVTATALLYMYLETIGADVIYYIPSRMDEGYGLHNSAADILHDKGVKLIITVDNGINSVSEAEYIKSLGMTLVVTDHHTPGEALPDAAAVVNPHRADDTSPFKDLAGVGVAFKLAAALENGDTEAILDDFSDIIAIGTIADIVPLKGENRTLAIRGIERINSYPAVGIQALKSNGSGGDKNYTSSNVAFGIAPRINAAGRIDSAEAALKLLLTDNTETAHELADKLDSYNTERQTTEAEILKEVTARVEADDKLKYSKILVVDGFGWHSGVIGIVASKLVERYGRPAMVVARDETGYAKGSCRSIEGFSLFEALNAVKDTLVKFGGHTLAAGFTVKDENIDKFRDKINDYALSLPPFYPVLKLDCRLNPAIVSTALVDSFSALEPFGAENPQPIFGLCRLTLKGVRAIGNGKHIRLSLEKNNVRLNAVYFGMPAEDFPYDAGDIIDIAATVDKNEFRGETRADIYVKAVRDSAADDDLYFSSAALYDKVRIGCALTEKERLNACPDRNFAAKVFRFIKNRGKCSMSPEQIALRLGFNSAAACRVNVTLDALCELELLNCRGGCYTVNNNGKKVDLASSEILSRLGYT
ncbi:MAG: single-stranded-DNA-specific exonuclease RecJ [Clostridiales bacterium]|nr:single-stranded-DNA-specific exonuclease RecJ [Clostridiales bacterium]